MKRLRKILRRGWKPVAMAFVAVTLALSLTVTTTQKAEANPLLLPPLILASGTVPVGTALGLVSLTGPIGWGIVGVGALAVGLAATQDYWLPYVTGDLGKSDNNPPAAQGAYVLYGLTYPSDMNGKPLVYAQDQHVVVKYRYDGPEEQYRAEIVGTIHCKSASGAVYTLEGQQQFPTVGPYPDKFPANNGSVYFSCNQASDVPDGWVIGAPGAAPELFRGDQSRRGPESVVRGGVYAEGGASFDPKSPELRYETTVECVRADGTFFSITASSTGDQGALKMPSCAAAEPGAHGTGKTDVNAFAPGTTMPTPVWTNPRIPASGEYPLCGPERPGPMCNLKVAVDGKPCVEAVGTWNCVNWRELANDPAQSARVQCSYGPYAGLAVDVCNPMERAYESPGGTVATEANLDGNPSTRNDSTPQGEPYQKPDGSTKPGGTLAEAPLSGTNPSSNPGEDGQNCLAHGWSWNPVSWVQVPAQCAMQWAFVPPRTRLDATVQALQPKLDAKGIKPFVVPFMENFGNIGGDGCKGPAISLSRIGVGQTLYPFDACGEPLAPIAHGVNTFFSFSIILQGGMSVIRAVAAGFGFNWGAGKDESS